MFSRSGGHVVEIGLSSLGAVVGAMRGSLLGTLTRRRRESREQSLAWPAGSCPSSVAVAPANHSFTLFCCGRSKWFFRRWPGHGGVLMDRCDLAVGNTARAACFPEPIHVDRGGRGVIRKLRRVVCSWPSPSARLLPGAERDFSSIDQIVNHAVDDHQCRSGWIGSSAWWARRLPPRLRMRLARANPGADDARHHLDGFRSPSPSRPRSPSCSSMSRAGSGSRIRFAKYLPEFGANGKQDITIPHC